MHGDPQSDHRDPSETLRRLEELNAEIADESLPQPVRDALCVEYAELVVDAFEDLLEDGAGAGEELDELREQVTGWRDELDAIYLASARRRVRLEWCGAERGDIELDGFVVADLWHDPSSGWMMTPAGEELGLPCEWVGPPGLDSATVDHAARRALFRVVDQVARISQPAEDDLL
ncbi:MAG TPA: hypothetical protein VFT50_15545 [Baekduia sp.]|nr:hypothetical protein [Baekduia sp.]